VKRTEATVNNDNLNEWLPMIQFYEHDYEPAGSRTGRKILEETPTPSIHYLAS
jgi:hypothetical protein